MEGADPLRPDSRRGRDDMREAHVVRGSIGGCGVQRAETDRRRCRSPVRSTTAAALAVARVVARWAAGIRSEPCDFSPPPASPMDDALRMWRPVPKETGCSALNRLKRLKH